MRANQIPQSVLEIAVRRVVYGYYSGAGFDTARFLKQFSSNRKAVGRGLNDVHTVARTITRNKAITDMIESGQATVHHHFSGDVFQSAPPES